MKLEPGEIFRTSGEPAPNLWRGLLNNHGMNWDMTCPNDPPCGHPSTLHDIYELGDPYPTCCAEGCVCGQPGDAVMRRAEDGTVTVMRADPVIRVSRELLDAVSAETFDGDVLTLDTAREYRYQLLRPDPKDPQRVYIFGRIRDAA